MDDQNKKIWIVGFPKSGNTWLSYLISYVANLPFEDFDAPGSFPKREQVWALVSGKNEHSTASSFQKVSKTHKLPSRVPVCTGDFVVYIHRDPRDMYVSFKSFMNNSFAGWKGRTLWRIRNLIGVRYAIQWVYGTQQRHIKAWKSRADISMSYEDLHENQHSILMEVASKIGSSNADVVEKAISHFSFEKMSEGRKLGQENRSSFFRKGVVGDWEAALSVKEKEVFAQLMR